MGRLTGFCLLFLLLSLPVAAAEFQAVAPGIFVRQGVDQDATATNDDAIANIGFIIGEEAVAIIDPGGSRGDGDSLRTAVRQHTDRPIRYVIMTHGHPDHVFGGAVFRGDKPVYVGHVRLPGALAARGAFYRHRLEDLLGKDAAGDFVVPTMLVAQHEVIDLGGRVLELDAWEEAHSAADLTVFDRNTRTLLAGDLVFIGRIPAVDGSVRGWLSILDRLVKIPALRVVPGHGPVSAPWPEAVTDERRYLETIRGETKAVLAAGGDIERAIQIVGQSERDKWALFDDYNQRNVTEAYRELEWE
jgi:quinoprotein relay system zinc metallohydrolase 2